MPSEEGFGAADDRHDGQENEAEPSDPPVVHGGEPGPEVDDHGGEPGPEVDERRKVLGNRFQLSDRLMVKVPARSILPMIAFRVALCITHNPVNGTVSQCRKDLRDSPDVASPCEPQSA